VSREKRLPQGDMNTILSYHMEFRGFPRHSVHGNLENKN
jgi:hypothetical protein